MVYKGEIYRVRNQLFPFSKAEAETWSGGALSGGDEEEAFFYRWLKGRALSQEAEKVMQAARDFYAYCYRGGMAEIWDAGYPQLRAAADEGGRALLNGLKAAHKALGNVLLPKMYDYGFIPADVEYFKEGE